MMQAVYDVEAFPNFFCAGFALVDDPDDVGYIFELSERRNDAADLFQFITRCKRMIGFNNMYYDWPMLEHFLDLLSKNRHVGAGEMFTRNQEIFAMPEQAKHLQLVNWRPPFEQLDLFMMHHLQRFGVALKQCEFAMRSRSIQDLPFPAGTVLTHEQMDVVLRYNAHDIRETKKMYRASLPAVQFRESINPEWISFNDGKIGKKTFERELEAAGVQLYEYVDGKKRPRQTRRPDGVRLGDVILPLVNFTRPENQALLERVKAELAIAKHDGGELYRPDGSPIHHRMNLDGFHIDIKLGGIHGCVPRGVVRGTPERPIIDADVTSYYPSIAIVHGIAPAHLGAPFCEIYGRLKARRVALDKKAPERTVLKYALNVPFGSSNDAHSIFFDPAYMLAITMNGQLMLCMLAEQFANVPGVELIQVNTDGVTIRFDVAQAPIVHQIYAWWQAVTGMDLEYAGYRSMHIRDANSYLAEATDGKRKRVGAYYFAEPGDEASSKFWQQDQSAQVVPRAAEAVMLDDQDPMDFLENHMDPWDFLILKKATGGARLQLADGTPLSKHTRFYISLNGQNLQKIMPPLPGKEDERRIGIAAEGQAKAIAIPGKKTRPMGYQCSNCPASFKLKRDFDVHNGQEHSWKITPCNEFDGKMPQFIDLNYYLAEIQKIVIDE